MEKNWKLTHFWGLVLHTHHMSDGSLSPRGAPCVHNHWGLWHSRTSPGRELALPGASLTLLKWKQNLWISFTWKTQYHRLCKWVVCKLVQTVFRGQTNVVVLELLVLSYYKLSWRKWVYLHVTCLKIFLSCSSFAALESHSLSAVILTGYPCWL